MPGREEKRALRQKWVDRIALATLIFFGLNSCNQISVPRLSFEEEPQERIPISINFEFDRQLTEASLQVEACDFDYTIPSGDLISQEFLKVSRERFANVQVLQPGGQAINVSGANAVTIELQLLQQSFTPKGKSGQEDRYLAEVSLQLLAIYKDPLGNPIAKTPLNYKDDARIWSPELSANSGSCATGQFDAEIQDAAEELAKTMATDMARALPQLFGQPPPVGMTAQGQPMQPFQPGQAAPVFRPPPTLSFRTMLQDGNDNFILEGGEKLVLQIETLNKGTAPISSAQIDLTGNPEILQAFAQVTTLPIEIDVIQPGETTTTEIRGIMPDISQEVQGKLIVTVSDASGQPIGSHNILAAIQPGQSPPKKIQAGRQTSRVPQGGGSPPSSNTTPLSTETSPYYAIIIGVDSYRDPWPHIQKKNKTNAKALIDALLVTGSFPQQHIRVLRNDHATKSDIEDVLFSWATPQLRKESILLVYFSGQAVVKPQNGEVYLVPYEGTPGRSNKGLISLRVLQKFLAQLPNKTTLLFLDTPITDLKQGKTTGPKQGRSSIKWASGIPTPSSSSPGKLIQIREKESLSDPARLWAGLLGRADRNGNQMITIGELLQDVQPFATITPPPNSNARIEKIPLTQ